MALLTWSLFLAAGALGVHMLLGAGRTFYHACHEGEPRLQRKTIPQTGSGDWSNALYSPGASGSP